MKKNFRFLICLATVAVAASCLAEKDLNVGQDGELVHMKFSAVVDKITTSDKTKTSLGDGFAVTWDEEESISVFSGTSHTEFSMVDRSDDGKTAVFEGLAEQTGVYHAVYPYSSEYSMDDAGTITVNLADSQSATAGGFDHGVNLSAATSTSTDLQFRNVGALVGVTVGNDNIKSVILTATEEDSYLAGKATLQFKGGLPEVTVTEGCASVRLNGDFVKGYTYYFVVYPGSYTNLKITYVDADGKIASKSNPNTLTLERNGNVTFGTMTMTDFISYTGGEDLFIGGEGAEAGQKFTLITPSTYYNVDSNYADVTGNWGNNTPYYEIYTRLEAGKKYYFYSDEYYFNAESFMLVADEAAASVTATDETAVYRIRINPETKEVMKVKVTSVVLDNPWGDDKDGVLQYKGRGVWGLSCFNIRLHVANWDHQRCDTRFKFYMTFDGVEGKQGFGAVADAGEAYWVQPTGGDDWSEWLFNFPGFVVDQNDEDRYSADVNLYMNNDNGHYTHEFVNVVDNQISGPLYIGGEGAEAGQQFTYVNTGYYNTSLDTYGDNFPMDMPYYEIHTQLKAGKDYYFYDLDSKISAAQVTEDGLYRIRISAKTGETVVTKKIKRLYFLHLDMKYQVDFEYSGNGVWSKNFKMEVDDNNGWRDDRYKFVLEFADGSIQHYGANHNDDNRYNNLKSAPEGYFDIQMTATSEWDGKFKITDAFHRQNATITVYLNNEKGHYTHEFSSRAVFMGDSITEWWYSGDNANPSFFTENGYVCKGISGQTTSQMLARFDQDVVALAPECVVILAGTNDIARNEGYADANADILNNIASMASKAANAGVKVILCSILPCDYYSWRPEITGQATRIVEVNDMICALAQEKGYTYVDYHSQMKTDGNALSGGYCTSADDRCHPNREGYTVMEGIIKPVIESLVQ